jgi:hypothetical protein
MSMSPERWKAVSPYLGTDPIGPEHADTLKARNLLEAVDPPVGP